MTLYKAVDGNAPAVDKPPAWFVFWKQGAVPDLSGFTYNHSLLGWGLSRAGGGSSGGDLLEVGPDSIQQHYGTSLIINGTQFAGAEGMDCLAEVTHHERQHLVFAYDEGLDTDNDRLPDYLEGTYGCVVGNPDTFDLEHKKKKEYATYGDNEYAVMVEARGKTGDASKDWSKQGMQW